MNSTGLDRLERDASADRAREEKNARGQIAVRATEAAMLKELGHEVAQAAGGAEALERLEADRRFDLILIDFAMPEMTGSPLAREIRRMWPGAPLLFVKGYAENDGLRAWTERGVKTLSKPFTEAMLAAAVTQALERGADAPPVVSAQR